jgi:hypothetical protein
LAIGGIGLGKVMPSSASLISIRPGIAKFLEVSDQQASQRFGGC